LFDSIGETLIMTNLTTTKIWLATALVAGSFAAVAQTSDTAGTSTTPSTSIGVTPQAAAEAARKAVPRSDTATVVRTTPNAADSARNATGTTEGTGDTSPRTTARAARADRN